MATVIQTSKEQLHHTTILGTWVRNNRKVQSQNSQPKRSEENSK